MTLPMKSVSLVVLHTPQSCSENVPRSGSSQMLSVRLAPLEAMHLFITFVAFGYCVEENYGFKQ